MSPKLRRHVMKEPETDRGVTLDEVLTLLRQAPPRQAIDDTRYWLWRQRVDALLLRVKE